MIFRVLSRSPDTPHPQQQIFFKITKLVGWDGMGWDGVGWDGVGWGGMGWGGVGCEGDGEKARSPEIT